MDFIIVMQSLLQGFALTFLLFILTLIFSLPLGMLIAFFSMSKIVVIKKITKIFVWIIRGVPLMLQLFIVYYLPGMLSKSGINVFGQIDSKLYFTYGIENGGAFIAALIAFVINYACYFSEIFRGGIESIPKGQIEAGQVLGLSKRQIFSKIIFIQVIKNILPPVSNEVMTLVKDTALARVIGVIEIIKTAETFTTTKAIIWPLFSAGAFYLVFIGVLTIVLGKVEKKLNFYRV